MLFRSPRLLLSLAILLCLTSCANNPSGQALQTALQADPRLKDNPPFGPTATPRPTQSPTDLPPELPLYPQGKLVTVTGAMGGNVLTKWSVGDNRDRVLSFYRQALQSDGWQDLKETTENTETVLSARHQTSLEAIITLEPADAASQGTNFVIQYGRDVIAKSSVGDRNGDIPQPGTADFIGPIPPKTIISVSPEEASRDRASDAITDIAAAPTQLQQYITDLVHSGALRFVLDKSKLEPNRVITRREYAQWLVAANNRIYAARSANQIRLNTEMSQPTFKDVPKQSPGFREIQGLAEAGLLPSALTGSPTVLFRPNAPLTREELIMWKVPIDVRQALPTATSAAIQQTWDFQDAATINDRALKAVLADFKNGDQANIRRAFGYTKLFQPQRSVTRAEAAAALWFFGYKGNGLSAADAMKEKASPPTADPTPAPAVTPTPAATASPREPETL